DHPVPEMTGADLNPKETREDFDPQTGEPIVLMQFTNEGAKKFSDLTRELARRGRILHGRVGGADENAFQQFAIVLDREIKTAPKCGGTTTGRRPGRVEVTRCRSTPVGDSDFAPFACSIKPACEKPILFSVPRAASPFRTDFPPIPREAKRLPCSAPPVPARG